MTPHSTSNEPTEVSKMDRKSRIAIKHVNVIDRVRLERTPVRVTPIVKKVA